jgi:hypothetical protein
LPNLRDEAREGVPARNAAAPGSEDAASTAMSTGRTVEIISVALWRDREGGRSILRSNDGNRCQISKSIRHF